MTLLEEDLKTVKTVLMQKRGGYHISEYDKKNLTEAMQRLTEEAKEV